MRVFIQTTDLTCKAKQLALDEAATVLSASRKSANNDPELAKKDLVEAKSGDIFSIYDEKWDKEEILMVVDVVMSKAIESF